MLLRFRALGRSEGTWRCCWGRHCASHTHEEPEGEGAEAGRELCRVRRAPWPPVAWGAEEGRLGLRRDLYLGPSSLSFLATPPDGGLPDHAPGNGALRPHPQELGSQATPLGRALTGHAPGKGALRLPGGSLSRTGLDPRLFSCCQARESCFSVATTQAQGTSAWPQLPHVQSGEMWNPPQRGMGSEGRQFLALGDWCSV